jgi:Baseplate J-like protein
MNQSLNNQFLQLLQQLNDEREQDDQQPQPENEEPEEIIDVYFVRREAKPEDTQQVVDSTPPSQNPPSQLFTAAAVFFCLIIPISSILFQLSLVFNPPIATVTIIPNVQTFTLKSTLHLGRLLHPITLSQSQKVPTTGKGHQDATKAAGTITFYNGQFTSQTIQAGTVLSGPDGVQIITDQDALIPAGNPPSYGQVTISAHAVQAGKTGNIPAYDINSACCLASVLAKNPENFTGGQDARDFQTVAKTDISNVATPLKTTLAQSTQGALQGQLKEGEEIVTLPCSPTVAADHQAGDEATKVTVTVSETCSAAAYNSQELKEKAIQLVTSQALKKLGVGYSMLGENQITGTQITTARPTPTLTFSTQGSFVYGLSEITQEHMKSLIAGKTKQEAMQILATFPGIKSISMQWDEQTKLPVNTRLIHIVIIVLNS